MKIKRNTQKKHKIGLLELIFGLNINKRLLTRKSKKQNRASFMPNLTGLCLAIIVAVTLSGCIKNSENRGFVTEFTDFDMVEVGLTTKEEAQKMLGSPSSKSNFGDEWYYIGMRLSQATLTNPEVVNQNIVVIKFDDAGVVASVSRKTEADKRDIIIADDVTPTEGNSLGVVEQLLGNMGKFEK